jgi:hypothetical protein
LAAPVDEKKPREDASRATADAHVLQHRKKAASNLAILRNMLRPVRRAFGSGYRRDIYHEIKASTDDEWEEKRKEREERG